MSDLKKKYKYINFVEVKIKSRPVYFCRSNKDDNDLGEIEWYPCWKQYCFFPEKDTLFNKSCLEDIANFLEQVNVISKGRKFDYEDESSKRG